MSLEPTPLADLDASPRIHNIVSLLLGKDGPREVTKRDKTKTMLTTLQLVDDTRPEGLELRIWGKQALKTAHLRIMDILQVTRVVAVQDKFGLFLSFRSDAAVEKAYDDGQYKEAVKRVAEWRDREHAELTALAEKGLLHSREWSQRKRARTGGYTRSPSRYEKGTLAWVVGGGEKGPAEIDLVRVKSLRVRVPADQPRNELTAVRALCRRYCTRCDIRLPLDFDRSKENNAEEEDKKRKCKCGCVEWRWGFGWLVLGLHDRSGDFFALAEGEAVGRLLFGVCAKRVWEDKEVAGGCAEILGGLVRDGGVFRVAVERRRGEIKLLLKHLFV